MAHRMFCLRLDGNYVYPEESGMRTFRYYGVNPDLTPYFHQCWPFYQGRRVGISYNILQNSCTVLTIRFLYSAKNLPQVTIRNQIVTRGTLCISSLYSVRRNAYYTVYAFLRLFCPTRPIFRLRPFLVVYWCYHFHSIVSILLL